MYPKPKNILVILFVCFCGALSGQNTNGFPPAPLAPVNDDPCNAIPLPVNTTCTLGTYTNVAATTIVGMPDPLCSFYWDADVWFSIVVPSSGIIQIQSVAGTMDDGGVAAYTGTCNGTLTEIGCDDDGGVGFMPQLNLSGLVGGSTLYLRFWDYGNFNPGTFQICVIDLCPGVSAPANDLPCNAESMQLSVYTQGSLTRCATGLNEPTPPTCWNNGAINTVWYSVVAASASMRIRCNPVTLLDPQIALYGGTCGLGLIELGCNDDGPACGLVSYFADLTVTGLTAGLTYYIAVDGGLDGFGGDLVGSFNIIAVDGAAALPPIPGQDCGTFQPICGQSFTVGNPGFTGVGNICDFNGVGICLVSGERASAWYEFTISANGNLEFDIVPNDWAGAPSTIGTDYDFAVWKTAGAGAVTCANIAAGSIPLRCNYNSLGVTGLFSNSNGNSPPAYPGFGGAYQQRLSVTAGDKYALVISNYSTSTSGFTLNFSGGSPITYGAGPGATVYWSGSTDTDWFKSANWGGCTVPTCSTNAVIGAGINNQPLISGGNANCQNLTINPGGTLTLNSPQTLRVCGNYINNGSLNAQAGALVLMNNASVAQQLSGNMIGTNALPGFTIHKTGSSVTLNQNLDLKANLSIDTVSSTFNVGSRTIKLSGNFYNVGTFSAVSGLLEFNGINAQTYFHGGIISNVRINHTGPGVTLLTNMNVSNLTKLTLDSGKIITNAFEVQISNRSTTGLTGGDTTSFVQGNLRRYINSTGSYDFPVGHSVKGLQRTKINFAYPAFPTTIDNLLVNFTSHASAPPALGATDCAVTFSSPGVDNGYWSYVANANPTVGRFDLTLYNNGYANAAAANGWTIMSSPTTSWVLANGTCVPTPVTAVQRLGMSGVRNFATAQSPNTPLPVEWLYIKAHSSTHSILLDWATASEDNNAGFEVHRSTNQFGFEKIGWVNGSGTSNVVNTYRYEDKTARAGINYYYRLRQLDFNGWYKESEIVTAKFNSQSISIVPNPIRNYAVISFYANSKNQRVDILNSTGVLIRNLINGVGEQGNQTYLLHPEEISLAPGCYIIRLIADDAVSHVSFCYIR